MKKTITLIPKELQPQLEVFTVHTVLLGMLCAFLSVFVFSNFSVSHNQVLTAQLDTLRNELDRKTNVLNIISAELENRTEDPILLRQSSSTESSLMEKRRLIAELEARDELRTQSFADLLETLASKHSSDMWLTSINVVGNNMVIKGQLDKPEALPMWVGQLSSESYFAGKEFQSAKVSRKKDTLAFELRTSGGTDNE